MDNDTISRQAAIDALDCINGTEEVLRSLPPVQPERKRGKWILKPNIYGVVYCSECDYELHTNNTNFCPNCGAEMTQARTESDGTVD